MMKKAFIIIPILLVISGCSNGNSQSILPADNLNREEKKEAVKNENTNSIDPGKLVSRIVIPAVVYVKTSEGSGSGVIIDKKGTILTNAHVVPNGHFVDIQLPGTKEYVTGYIIGKNIARDVAIIKISDETELPYAEMGDSNLLEQGEQVFSLGYSEGMHDNVSIKEGIFSRTQTVNSMSFIESSAEMQEGSSGGPLVNKEGKIVGIAKGFIPGRGDALKLYIPINVIKDLIPALESGNSEKDIDQSNNESLPEVDAKDTSDIAEPLAPKEEEKPPVQKEEVLPSASVDTDNDKLNDLREYELGTNMKSADSDGDSLNDYEEVEIYASDPLVADSDWDGFSDGDEVSRGYNPIGIGKIIKNQ